MELTPRMKANAAVARRAAAEGMVLLKNAEHALPLAGGTKIAVLGIGQIYTIKGGTGSGEVNNLKTVNVLEGLEACENLVVDEVASRVYRAWALEHPMIAQGLFAAGEQKNCNDEVPVHMLDMEALAAANDAAVIVISRIAGEGMDMEAKKGTLYLTDGEEALVKAAGKAFGKTVLLLNTPGYMEIADILPEVSAVLFIGLPGQEGGHAVADILTGTVPVSGKVSDTWPRTYADYPNCAYYSKFLPNGNVNFSLFAGGKEEAQTDAPYHDDIYVGYRYFDTFGKDVLFPFGYGLSYGAPVITETSVALEQAMITVTATVKNECPHNAAREVVQVYVSAPDGKLEKPYQELKGYAKTGVLQPGESETVTITIPAASLASYDEATASYILEPGMYYIRVGNSSRSTAVAGAIEVAGEIRVQQLKNLLGTVPEGFELLSKKTATPISYENEAAEKKSAAARALRLSEREISCETARYSGEYVSAQPKPGLTLLDVAAGKGTLEELAATMDFEDLCKLVCGQGMDFSGFEMPAGMAEEREKRRKEREEAAKKDNEGGEDIFAALAAFGMGGPKLEFIVAGEAGQSPDYTEKYGIPAIVMCDGPAGVRITRDLKKDGEIVGHQYCTAFPTGSLLASSWDDTVLEAVGKAAGIEMAEYRVDLWLAPGMNIHRSPLCGRNFEYYSEDPVCAGRCAAGITRGVQSQGGGVTVKHFAGNSQEFMRGNSDDTVSERAFREIYLKGFEICVRTAAPKAIMTSYNDINGVPAADNRDLCTALLRDEWGFDGLVMTDWGGGLSTPVISMYAGNDMIQPGGAPSSMGIKMAVEAGAPVVSKGRARVTVNPTRAIVEKSAVNIMRVAMSTITFKKMCK